MPVDGRSRLDPDLPPGYFGSVLFFATPIAQAGDLVSEPFLNTVKRVSEQLKEMNNDYLRSAIDYIENVADINTIVRGSNARFPTLTIISWVWLPIHQADVGWGRPVYMRPPKIVSEGKSFILPSATDDGSLSLVIRLQTSHMKVFEKPLYEF